jgi:hypothetical protein
MFLLHDVLEGAGLVANPLKSVLAVTRVLAILLKGVREVIVAIPLESVLAVTRALPILLQSVLEVEHILTTGRALAVEDLGVALILLSLAVIFKMGLLVCGVVR